MEKKFSQCYPPSTPFATKANNRYYNSAINTIQNISENNYKMRRKNNGKNTSNTIDNQKVTMEEFFKDAVASTIKSKSRPFGEAGAMSVVKAETGNRVTVSGDVLEKLNNPETLQIEFKADSLVIGENLPSNESCFSIKKSGKKGIIYNTELVRVIAEMYELDFSDRTSITFIEAEFIDIGEYPVAIVKMR